MHVSTASGYTIVPTILETARPFPGIIPYAQISTQIAASIGAYIKTQKFLRTPSSFFEGTIQKTFSNNIAIAGHCNMSNPNTPLPHVTNQVGLIGGYTKTITTTTDLDFINIFGYFGITCTSKLKNIWFLPLGIACEWGIYDWLTIGLHETFFLPCSSDALQQNILAYCYADHIIRGACALCGLSHTYQTSTSKEHGWQALTLHASVSFDLASLPEPNMPTIAIYIDYALAKKAAIQAQHRLGLSCSYTF